MLERIKPRKDDFATRGSHLHNLSDAELKAKFWGYCDEIVKPLIDMAKTHTTPAVERAVLLRMGFSSLEVAPIVNQGIQHGLMKYGIGQAVYVTALHEYKNDIRKAGLALLEGKHWTEVEGWIKAGKK